MTDKPIKNEIAVNILRRVRTTIASKKETYICYALDRLASNYGFKTDHKLCSSALVALIAERLGDSASLEGWLIQNQHVPYSKPVSITGDKRLSERARITRLAWIDSLIEEFS